MDLACHIEILHPIEGLLFMLVNAKTPIVIARRIRLDRDRPRSQGFHGVCGFVRVTVAEGGEAIGILLVRDAVVGSVIPDTGHVFEDVVVDYFVVEFGIGADGFL